MSTIVRDVTEAEFTAVVIEGSKDRPVVVDFWAEWCGPCRQLSPVLEEAARNYAGEVDVVKVDVDANPQLAQAMRIQGIPAVKAFADGKMVSEFTGLQPPQVIDQFFAALAPSAADRLVVRAASEAPEQAKATYREAMELEVDHPDAALGLAALLLDEGDTDGAKDVLALARPIEEVTQLQATLALGADGGADLDDLRQRVEAGEDEARVELGRALAGAGQPDEAIAVLLDAVRTPATKEEGRTALLDVFTALGNDHPLVRAARPRLAAALF